MPTLSIRNITIITSLFWLPSLAYALLTSDGAMTDFFFWRHQLIMLSGMLALVYMSLAVVLAARFQWLENIVNGLDKSYALHKNLGIGSIITLVAHWAMVKSAHWLIDSGAIAMPQRGPRPEQIGIDWRGIAEGVGDVSFKLFLLFSIISLVQSISYKKFRFVHKIGGVLMLAGVFHSMLLMDWNFATLPMNTIITLFCLAGTYCSVLSLTGKIGRSNQASGEVTQVDSLTTDGKRADTIRFSITLSKPIRYKEGQFAYLNFHDGESPHPFSILNYNAAENMVEFGVKDLGDYTHKLVQTLQAGQRVTVEGGYGYFQIPEDQQQVWVGAGIGIVPFISRLYWLAHKAKQQPNDAKHQPVNIEKIHLFYCVNSRKEAYFEKEITNVIGNLLNKLDIVELEIVDAEKGQLLDAQQVLQKTQGQAYNVSFCGPRPFATSLKSDLVASGLNENNFHSELFKMR
ncbi:ferric reductase-like transmembrane domain-containing protein [Vibrio sp. MACH09]|uniref:ferredoxin reductase family protein n=1 Tax=Vibrio sp. MACH09 TaxID=3025122 RepID=UPI00295E6230|nr:ferric reductase-like transmembrane domain-containing protein [Vibrio sp. MACH09]